MPRVHGCSINPFHAQTWLKWFDFTVQYDLLDCNCPNTPTTVPLIILFILFEKQYFYPWPNGNIVCRVPRNRTGSFPSCTSFWYVCPSRFILRPAWSWEEERENILRMRVILYSFALKTFLQNFQHMTISLQRGVFLISFLLLPLKRRSSNNCRLLSSFVSLIYFPKKKKFVCIDR